MELQIKKAKANEKKAPISGKTVLRLLQEEDYERVKEIQLKCFPEMKPWSQMQWKSITDRFPKGQIGIEVNNKLVASSCSLRMFFDEFSSNHSWNSTTGNGMSTTHRNNGDTLYGIEIMVDPDYQNYKLARRIYNARKELVKEDNIKRIVIGGRLPNYHLHSDKLQVKEYVEQVIDKKISDPVLTTQLSNGFKLKRIIKDYLPNDKESCGFATFMEWVNLDYQPGDFEIKTINQYVRVCAIQYQMRLIDSYEEFEKHCEYFIDVASDYHCDFILFPELFTMQLMSFMPANRPGTQARLLTEFTERFVSFFRSMSVKYNINIIGGSHMTVEDGELYNISYLFRRDGTFEKQYKLHITPHEKKWWGVKPGNKLEVFDTDCGKISILICYDVEFPELARLAALKGARILFVPYNTDDRRAYLRVRYCSQARAIENQLYVVMTGCVGNLPQVDNMDIHYSQAAILTPSDVEFQREAIASLAEAGDETLIFQDLDMQLLKRNIEYGSVQLLKDRRTDLYSIHFKDGDQTIVV
ncbi:MAG: carbon-nitrogen hydrolase family protein [Panacibacter sp.]